MYQRKKTGLPINPFSKNDKIAGQIDDEEFYDEVVPLGGGVSHSQEIIRQSNENSVRSNVNLSRSNDNLARSNENLNFASKTNLSMTK